MKELFRRWHMWRARRAANTLFIHLSIINDLDGLEGQPNKVVITREELP